MEVSEQVQKNAILTNFFPEPNHAMGDNSKMWYARYQSYFQHDIR